MSKARVGGMRTCHVPVGRRTRSLPALAVASGGIRAGMPCPRLSGIRRGHRGSSRTSGEPRGDRGRLRGLGTLVGSATAYKGCSPYITPCSGCGILTQQQGREGGEGKKISGGLDGWTHRVVVPPPRCVPDCPAANRILVWMDFPMVSNEPPFGRPIVYLCGWTSLWSVPDLPSVGIPYPLHPLFMVRRPDAPIRMVHAKKKSPKIVEDHRGTSTLVMGFRRLMWVSNDYRGFCGAGVVNGQWDGDHATMCGVKGLLYESSDRVCRTCMGESLACDPQVHPGAPCESTKSDTDVLQQSP